MKKTVLSMRRFIMQLLIPGIFMLSVTLTFGQVTTSGINGVVSDTKGETLPGATILAVHLPSGSQYGAVTNTDGRFVINSMRVGGPYKITVSFVGYKEQSTENIILSLGISSFMTFELQEASSTLAGVEVVSYRNDAFNSDRTGASASY